jgi:hypothetical protein
MKLKIPLIKVNMCQHRDMGGKKIKKGIKHFNKGRKNLLKG